MVSQVFAKQEVRVAIAKELETDRMSLGEPRGASLLEAAGLVMLYAPDPHAVPSAIAVTDRPLIIGRDPPPGEVVLPWTSVSRLHARISRRGQELVVDDLDSRNGTFVNGLRVRSAYVEHGDVVRIGEVVFKIATREITRHVAAPLAGLVPPPPVSALRGGVAMERVRNEVLRVAPMDLSVVVLGEAGTGKELVARALHDASGRSGPFQAINCAAVPGSLLESELFGYKCGGFTGADHDRQGVIAAANGGTLFLDEIGDMPLEVQAKVLRMIETRTVMPLGGVASEPVDVRLVCATHRPLARLVREDRFRADLFARISGHTIVLPSLRERKEDIFQLAHLFLARAGAESKEVASEFMIGLLAYDWPFNVRELEAAIKRAVAVATVEPHLMANHLPPGIRDALEGARTTMRSEVPSEPRVMSVAPNAEALRAILGRHTGNVAAVARELGKDRVQIHRWMKRHGLRPDDFRIRRRSPML
jgi:transcriptional regulator of acetoin/glycerol metabolism